jgi:hypothetical protein
MKNEKFCPQLSTLLKPQELRSKQGLDQKDYQTVFAQLERLKPRNNISEIGLSWMKETLDISF